ncbi:MAG: 30S ribosomal protein S16 [Cyclonatronaceae bacterium]
MVKLRLQRHGRKRLPYYHVVATDIRNKRDGRIIEDLGRYNPVSTPVMVDLKTDRIIHWLQTGAQPTDTVRNLLKKEGIFYRLHLLRWNKSEEEIETTISEWKTEKSALKSDETGTKDRKAAQVKAEEEAYKKAQAKKAEEAAVKAKEAEKAKAEKAAIAEAEEAAAEAAESSAETAEATGGEETAETGEAPAEEVTAEASAETKAKAEESKQEAKADDKKAETAAETTEAPVEEAKSEADETSADTEKKDKEEK